MGNFWKTSKGETAKGEVPENNGFAPLPKGDYPVMIEDCTVQEWQGVKNIQLRVRVTEGFGANRVLFLRINAWDAKESKRDRAIEMLMKLHMVTGVAPPEDEPDDVQLSRLVDKFIVVMLDIWESDRGDGKSGNWLVTVKEKGTASKPAEKAQGTMPDPSKDDDIPF